MAPSVVGAVLLLAAVGAGAAAAAPTPCPTGFFGIDGGGVTGLGTALTRITLDAAGVAVLDACPEPAAVTIKARKKATLLRATWASCPGFPDKVTLKARIAAPACSTLSGVLVARKAKPKRTKLRATRLDAAGLVGTLHDPAVARRMIDENLPALIRAAAEVYNPELVALIALGPAALDQILPAFERAAIFSDDTALSLLAYALERIGDPRAIPVLLDWLESHLFTALPWASEFVTHTIKVLDGQTDLHTTSYAYLIDDKLDAIAQARAGEAAGAATLVAATSTNVAATPRAAVSAAQNQCAKTVTVTGINASGQQESIAIGYNAVFFDLDQQIDLETDPAKRTALTKQRDLLRESDDSFFNASDYRATGDVSVQSNCGGSVTERLLNEVAARKGIPLTLGLGNATGGKVDGVDVSGADVIRDIARKFGGEVELEAIDPLTVIAQERPSGKSAHVEIPISDGADSVTVFSKDNQGRPRLHTVQKQFSTLNPFAPIQRRYNFRPFYEDGQTSPKFYRIDPSRIVSIVVDSSACPCDFAYGGVIPVAFTEPADPETDERVITVAGTVGDADAASGNLRVNGSPQAIAVGGGAFSSQVVLTSGDNTLRVAIDGADGRRGCAERMVRSTTPRTTISATLTWNLAGADVDLYVGQPDGETAWYSARTTTIGGRLDVDNTSGHGPENYFLSSEEGDMILPGAYVVRVHYFGDHEDGEETPTRPVEWRVVVILNEGTPQERRTFHRGTLSVANGGNSSPGGSGPDWATVTEVTLPAP